MKKVLVVAPHPDDKTLGCGGTLLRHKAQGDEVSWLIITDLSEENGVSPGNVSLRKKEIENVGCLFGFSIIHNLRLPTTRLDRFPMAELIERIGNVFQKLQPEVVYLPYPGDVHTDHRIVFDGVASCTKWFRYSFIKRVLAYETLSETDFGINPDSKGFNPNVFVDITPYLGKKLEIMKVYASELGSFPFPRSEESIRALAALRGVAAGCTAAESFMLLKEIV